jgi:hypothetical protein
MVPERFARDEGAERQGDDLPAAGFEHLPSPGADSWHGRRVGKINNRRLGKERRAGELVLEFLAVAF